MDQTDDTGDLLRQEISACLVPLQTAGVVDRARFSALLSAVAAVAAQLKGTDLISKSLLREIVTTAKVLRAEALHLPDEGAALVRVADELDVLCDLILADETPDDRRPGVPRIT